MTAFLKLILITIIIVIVAVALVFFWLYRKVNSFTRTFTGGSKSGRSQPAEATALTAIKKASSTRALQSRQTAKSSRTTKASTSILLKLTNKQERRC